MTKLAGSFIVAALLIAGCTAKEEPAPTTAPTSDSIGDAANDAAGAAQDAAEATKEAAEGVQAEIENAAGGG